MTTTIKTAIDTKINQLGFSGCLNFLVETQLNPYATTVLNSSNYRRIIRSELVAENWDDLTQLFLDWTI